MKAYLLKAFGMPLPGKIDSHFSPADTARRDGNWTLRSCLNSSRKRPLISPRAEVVDDDESSQSNIDELLHEDGNFLGDIPGDELVEELSIKLEENLFEDHLGQNAEFLAVS